MIDTQKPEIKKLIDIAIKHSLTSITIETENFEISFSKTNYKSSPKIQTDNKIEDSINQRSYSITSPYVGYYRGSVEGIKEGTIVEPGTVIAYVEALGLSNEIITNQHAVIEDWLLEPGTPVEYGTPIVKIRAFHEN